jgi:nucleolar pre-ribosomal-associated protein 1
LVLTYPSIASTTADILAASPDLLKRQSSLVVVASLLDIPCGAHVLHDAQGIAETAISAISSSSAAGTVQAAIDVLVCLSEDQVGVVNTALEGLTGFSPFVGKLLERLSAVPTPAYEQGLRLGGIWGMALRYAVRVCSDLAPISADQLEIMQSLGKLLLLGREIS